MALGVVDRARGNINRLIANRRFEELRAGLLRHHFELFDRGGPIDVRRHCQDFLVALSFQPARELSGGGGLSSALQAR